MKISLDYDGVLSQHAWQTVAVNFVETGHEVYILTGRCADQGDRVLELADRLDIERDHVLFTCNRDKWETVEAEGIELHLDNNADQLALIEEMTDAIGLDTSKVPPYEAIKIDPEDYD